MDKVPPPTHLSDLRIIPLMETHGRERRWRYFTFASYREIVASEKLDDQDGPYSSVDFSNVGNFAPFVAEDFYSDVVELNRLMDYAFTKTGKTATPTTGKKRKRGEAGLDTADHPPRKRGRPRKHPVEGANATEKGATTKRDRGQSIVEERLGSTQPEGPIISNDLHSSSPKVPKKRRRPPDDNHGSEIVPEASVAPRRRGRPRKQPPSRPPTDEIGHSPLQIVINSSDLHTAHHPISEPLPDVDVTEAEARSTLNESETALQYPESFIQPDLTSTIYDHRSVVDPEMRIIDDNQLRPAQPGDSNTDPRPTGTEDPRELDVEGVTLVRMDICSELSVSVDAPSGAKFRVCETGHRA